jgi:hypothetical protein
MSSISWKTPVPDKATVRLTLGAVVAVAVFLGLSWNDGHYWDEYFYLYSVFAHSPAELVRFEVQSAMFPVGFFSDKIGHVALLDLLTTVLGAGPNVLYAIQAGYALLLLGFFGAAYGLLRGEPTVGTSRGQRIREQESECGAGRIPVDLHRAVTTS